MSPSELASTFNQLSPKEAATAITQIEDYSTLESIGKIVRVDQALAIFLTLPNAVKRLTPLILGMSHKTFREVILKGSEEEIMALKQQGMNEPLQHHITTYKHELKNRIESLNKTYALMDAEIISINPEIISRSQLQKIWQSLCSLSEGYQKVMQESSILLLLAWNTNREDLIEELTEIKEQCHRISRFGVGFPANNSEASSGLFNVLDQSLFRIYSSEDDIEGVKDHEPAIEGLYKISAWYLEDYWELGLLPQIETKEELDLDRTKYSQQVRREYHDKLMLQVQTNLSKLGLETVQDLKENWIYSKESLTSFITMRKGTF